MKIYINSSSKLSDRDDWFQIWQEDKDWIIDVMSQNISDDLAAGYDPNGKSIKEQKSALAKYREEYDADMDMFKYMGEKDINRWCFYDLKKRGAID